jgi:hypothetical protein
MSTTRRSFLLTGAVASGLSVLARCEPRSQSCSAEEPAADQSLRCLDYARSFIFGTAAFNNVRFWVESRTTIVDEQHGTTTDYYQCASCKSENTFAEENLFHHDNYDFLPILGDGRWLIFRRPARISETYRKVGPVEDLWGAPRMLLREAAKITELTTWEQIRDATAAGWPLVTRTELRNETTGLRAVIECPCKTMNISIDHSKYQVDTGPIAWPDLSDRREPQIECLHLAFLAFNAPHFADFVVEQPTPVLEDGKEVARIYHYSSPFSQPATNRILAQTE